MQVARDRCVSELSFGCVSSSCFSLGGLAGVGGWGVEVSSPSQVVVVAGAGDVLVGAVSQTHVIGSGQSVVSVWLGPMLGWFSLLKPSCKPLGVVVLGTIG